MGVSLPWGGRLGGKDRCIHKVGPSQGADGLLTVPRRRVLRTLPFPTGWAVELCPGRTDSPRQNSEGFQDHMGIELGRALQRNRSNRRLSMSHLFLPAPPIIYLICFRKLSLMTVRGKSKICGAGWQAGNRGKS